MNDASPVVEKDQAKSLGDLERELKERKAIELKARGDKFLHALSILQNEHGFVVIAKPIVRDDGRLDAVIGISEMPDHG